MRKNQEITPKSSLASAKEILAGILSVGVVVAGTHGALIPDYHIGLSPVDFSAKVTGDLHDHSHIDYQFLSSHIIVDPKHLRSVRSEGDKVGESDSLRGNWDVYQV